MKNIDLIITGAFSIDTIKDSQDRPISGRLINSLDLTTNKGVGIVVSNYGISIFLLRTDYQEGKAVLKTLFGLNGLIFRIDTINGIKFEECFN